MLAAAAAAAAAEEEAEVEVEVEVVEVMGVAAVQPSHRDLFSRRHNRGGPTKPSRIRQA